MLQDGRHWNAVELISFSVTLSGSSHDHSKDQ